MPNTLPRALVLLALTWVGVYWIAPGPWRPARAPRHLPDYSAERDLPSDGSLGPITTERQPPGGGIDGAALDATEPAPASGDPGSLSPPAGDRFHVVEPGDSLWKISLRYYGSGDRAGAIFEANRDVLKSPASLKLGTRLRIPPP